MWGSANAGMRNFLLPCPYSRQNDFYSISGKVLGKARECFSIVPVQKVSFLKAHFSDLLKWLSPELFSVIILKDFIDNLGFSSGFFLSPIYITGLAHCSCDVADGNCFDNWYSEIPYAQAEIFKFCFVCLWPYLLSPKDSDLFTTKQQQKIWKHG